jgi:asparagine synthase (glutamine-hydrolysing)
LYNKGGIEFMCENLYGVFAFILLDTRLKRVYCGRDTFGVRPLFRVLTPSGTLAACSEAKGLMSLVLNDTDRASGLKVQAVEPGTLEEYRLELDNNNNHRVLFERRYKFHKIGVMPKYDVNVTLTGDIFENIRRCLTNAVRMRLMSQRRIGCLLSGGLDSSLICGLLVQEARKAGINYPLQTFSIGMGDESPDVMAARKVAKHLNTEHHEVIFTGDEAFNAVREVIKALESYDITTIRASIGKIEEKLDLLNR